MGAPSITAAFGVGLDVLRSVISDATGMVMAQLGSVTSESVETDEAEWWQHVGFLSRPPKATAKKAACQAITMRRGDRDAIIATRDLRGASLAGNLRDGETCLYAAGKDGEAQARVILKDDGSVSLFTTDTNTSRGHTVYLRLAPTGMSFAGPCGKLNFDDSGFHVVHRSGARLDLGAIGGIPAPLDKINSYASITAAMANVNAAIVSAGGPTGMPAAQATPLLVYLAEIVAALNVIGTAVTSASALTGTSGVTPAQSTALVSALAALAAPPPISSSVAVG